MKIGLRSFQTDAVDKLTLFLDGARSDLVREETLQAVGLAAPTGSGKTIIATALIERLIFGGDDTPADPGATFLWITDQPELNDQTYDKMILASSRLGPDRLEIIDNAFDAESLSPGKVWFINTQKLGEGGILTSGANDVRHWSFWETMRNTIEADGVTLYVIVDEAHRGMAEANNLATANSIIQRFIKGWDVMPPAPVILGVSATPARYDAVIAGTGRHSRPYVIEADVVRASGLIKEHILTTHAEGKATDEIALLGVAAQAWKDSTAAWATYCAAAHEADTVIPAMVVQVENEDPKATSPTRTDLAAAIAAITDVTGPLSDDAFCHAFQGRADFAVGGRTVRYIAPSRISDDIDAKVIFFKSSLNTGWDCPRAEVMFSFRTARDDTSIAQLIGRMVRAPLARRIDEDERLNAVDLFLPHYDKVALEAVIKYLTEAGDGVVADSIIEKKDVVALPIAAGMDAAKAAIEAVPTYLVPTVRRTAPVRRLRELTTALSAHGIDADASARETNDLAAILLAARERLKDDEEFKATVVSRGEITVRQVDWLVGEKETGEGKVLKLDASEDNIASLFAAAKRVLGGEVAVAYWKARLAVDASLTDEARLEAVALAVRDEVRADLDAAAKARIEALFTQHAAAIAGQTPARKAVYSRVLGQAGAPTLIDPAGRKLPGVALFPAGPEDLPRHLYARADGMANLRLNTWEAEAIKEELADESVVAWLRNPARQPWSLCLPYPVGTTERPMYPDFLIVRQVEGGLVVDILDPHDPGRPDASDKGKGMARYASTHGHEVGRIDMAAKLDGRLRRLHLKDAGTREKVAAAGSPNALTLLYPTD